MGGGVRSQWWDEWNYYWLVKRKKETHALVNEQVQILNQLCLAEKQHQNLWGILFMCFAAGLLNKSERQKEKKKWEKSNNLSVKSQVHSNETWKPLAFPFILTHFDLLGWVLWCNEKYFATANFEIRQIFSEDVVALGN